MEDKQDSLLPLQRIRELADAKSVPSDRIGALAETMWEWSGRKDGMAEQFWLAAEKNVLATLRAATAAVRTGNSSERWAVELAALSPSAFLQRIRLMAYYIWEASGRLHGTDVDNWLKAENDLVSMLAASAAKYSLIQPYYRRVQPQPYHRRYLPSPQIRRHFESHPDKPNIDLRHVHLPPYPGPDSSGALPDSRALANSLFDGRAAAAVASVIADPSYGDDVLSFITLEPIIKWSPPKHHPPKGGWPGAPPTLGVGVLDPRALLEIKVYRTAPTILLVTSKCLAAMAYADFFPDAPNGEDLRSMVSDAIMKASPGWCGTFGPGVTGALSLKASEGNYDMTQMIILPLIYNYYELLRPEAANLVITQLLARGRIQRPNVDDTFTSGPPPDDWFTAGYVSPLAFFATIPETENHVLMIATARYLTNQLLYQMSPDPQYDNRRNGVSISCTLELLTLLRYMLRNDFAEYNAKPYQTETRRALLNLCSYAYDAEVKVAARMVLDFISAHIAISSNDLRRMVPFRRLNENDYVKQIPGKSGFMDVRLLNADESDPSSANFALLAGNTRAYRDDWLISYEWDVVIDAVSDYRLPPSIHDLFVNDLHRRFFQRLHRKPLGEPGGQQNCDNMEIYASSPSYLITAGGRPATWVIPGQHGFGYKDSNIGVAVPISFMSTGKSASNNLSMQQFAGLAGLSARPISLRAAAGAFGSAAPFSVRQLLAAAGMIPNPKEARDLIQISHFSAKFAGDDPGDFENYGVAPTTARL